MQHVCEAHRDKWTGGLKKYNWTNLTHMLTNYWLLRLLPRWRESEVCQRVHFVSLFAHSIYEWSRKKTVMSCFYVLTNFSLIIIILSQLWNITNTKLENVRVNNYVNNLPVYILLVRFHDILEKANLLRASLEEEG